MPSHESMADQLRPLAKRIGPISRKFPVVRMVADLGGDDPDRAVELARTEVLRWMRNRSGWLPKQAWDGQDFEYVESVSSASGVNFRQDGAHFWAARLHDPDKKVPGRAWNAEILIARDVERNISRFGFNLHVVTREEFADIVPGVPGVVQQVINATGLERNGRIIKRTPTLVESREDFDDFMRLMRDSRRRRPLYAVALDERGIDPASAAIDVEKLARNTVGIAHVYILTGEASFWLSDAVGKNISVFMRAVRTYRAGFNSDEDEPYDHPLALPDRIETWRGKGPDAFISMLIKNAAYESLRHIDPERDVPSFTAVKNAALHMRREAITEQKIDSEAFSLLEQELELAKLELEDQKEEISGWKLLAEGEQEKRASLESERGGLRAQLYNLRTRINALEKGKGGDINKDIDMPDTFDDLAEWAEKNLPSLIHITGRAARVAKDGLYEDIGLVYRCLIMLAREYRDSRIEGGGEALEKKKQELGVEISRTFAGSGAGKYGDTYFVRHGGRRCQLDMHVKKGTDHDQRNCLRIYFFWDDEDQTVVVGSLPGHLKNQTS